MVVLLFSVLVSCVEIQVSDQQFFFFSLLQNMPWVRWLRLGGQLGRGSGLQHVFVPSGPALTVFER